MRVIHVSNEGLNWLAELEGGYRLKAYVDQTGTWTISAGVTRYSDSVTSRVREGDVLGSLAEAQALFARRLHTYEAGVDAITRDDLSQCEFDALVAFAYNLGVESLRASTLLRLVNAGASTSLIHAQFLRWKYADTDPNHPGLEVVPGLLHRREAEARCYEGNGYFTQGQIAEEAA